MKWTEWHKLSFVWSLMRKTEGDFSGSVGREDTYVQKRNDVRRGVLIKWAELWRTNHLCVREFDVPGCIFDAVMQRMRARSRLFYREVVRLIILTTPQWLAARVFNHFLLFTEYLYEIIPPYLMHKTFTGRFYYVFIYSIEYLFVLVAVHFRISICHINSLVEFCWNQCYLFTFNYSFIGISL